MRVFLCCCFPVRKKGGEKRAKKDKHSHASTNFCWSVFGGTGYHGYWLLSIMGSALFFRFVVVVSSSLHHKTKLLSHPPHLRILFSIRQTERERERRGSFELDRLARKQHYSWQNVRIIYLTERGKREKERKLVKKR